MAENDAPERIWMPRFPIERIGGLHNLPTSTIQINKNDVEYVRADPAAPDVAQIGKLLDAWELLPNDVKSDLRREFPSFADSITKLFQPTESGDYEQ